MTVASQIIEALGRPAEMLTGRATGLADPTEIARNAREVPVELAVDGPSASSEGRASGYVHVALSGACERACVGGQLGLAGLAGVRHDRIVR